MRFHTFQKNLRIKKKDLLFFETYGIINVALQKKDV